MPAGGARSLTGDSFRKLIETLLRVRYRALRKPASHKQQPEPAKQTEAQGPEPEPDSGAATKKTP